MNEIEKIREEISKTDGEMLALFEKRMSQSALLAEYKKTHGLPILDREAESAILSDNLSKLQNQKFAPYYVDFMENVMNLSNRYQNRLNEGMKVAYNGEEGAFAHIAAKTIFPGAVHKAYPSFSDAYASVENGECDCAVIPVENSYAGEVGAVMDLMFDGSLKLTGAFTLPVVHNLLAKPGASVEDIELVLSHSQALAQCEKYINSRGWSVRAVSSTSYAAQLVAESAEKNVAAIASDEAAKTFGLEVLDHDINESGSNTTKFGVFSRADYISKGSKDGRFIMMFTVNNVAGALAKAINIIGENGFNMLALRSRSVKQKAWQYYFYAELEGDETSENGVKMLGELSQQCETIKIIGHYAAGSDLSDRDIFKIEN